jgi:hypothetical protein
VIGSDNSGLRPQVCVTEKVSCASDKGLVDVTTVVAVRRRESSKRHRLLASSKPDPQQGDSLSNVARVHSAAAENL